MNSPWLNIVGVPEQGLAALTPDMQMLLEKAELIIGVPRRLAGLDRLDGRMLMEWNGSLEIMVSSILDARRAPTVLLASGDPNWFGIAATLSSRLERDEFAVHPAPSSFQLAAARMHWPMHNLTALSVHGRDPALLHPHVLPGNRILALTSDATTLTHVAGLLNERGYGQSRLTILENLGSADERITECTAATASEMQIGDFYVLAIDCAADEGAPLLAAIPGLPDSAFANDGQLTKREVRTSTLAKLAPTPGALLWDVGAGCGSIGIEWMRAARDARALCFEHNKTRVGMIVENRQSLGVPGLEIVEGQAPLSFADRPSPDAVFLGGDVANDALFEACWQALKPQGRFVANAVTPDGEAALYQRQGRFGGELVRIDIAVLDAIGFVPRRPVTQWAVTRGAAE